LAEEEKEVAKVPTEGDVPKIETPLSLLRWVPRTILGKEVFEGKITDINPILNSRTNILEPEIVDKLLPEIKNEVILIGGRAGKGGGKERIPIKITAKMKRSGRRFTTNAFVVVGNEDGIVGVGRGTALEARDSIEKAMQKAKMHIIRVKRGCGSWECGCGTEHSIPFRVEGKSGSVRVILMPAPKGIGLVADNETKKILRLAGIKDIWIKTYGNTSMRINLISAIFDALKKVYVYEKGQQENVGEV
jgi:small subunit ribosomal protein S5